jgi:RNA polymerase-binding transcription factor DksA
LFLGLGSWNQEKMKQAKLITVLDHDMKRVLQELDQFEAIENGEIYCHECGVPITLKNIQIIIPMANGKLEYVCNNVDCVQGYGEKHRAK